MAELKRQETRKIKETQQRYSEEFWEDVTEKLKNDTDYIKSLIRDGTIRMNDVSGRRHSLLQYAAYWGNYEITQLCINLGSNLHHIDAFNMTPLKWARAGAAHHIEQLILLSQMEANVGDRVKNLSSSINRQRGIISNMVSELTLIGEQSNALFTKASTEVMVNLIQKKLLFSDDLLCFCWKRIEKKDALKSELWKTISATCQSIIQSSNKRDWWWLKNCILPSNIWYSHVEGKEDAKTYLYYELLGLVRAESQRQLDELEKKLKCCAVEDDAVWTRLVTWDIPPAKLHPLKNDLCMVRQDNIANGIESDYSEEDMYGATTAQFDGSTFYDHHEYLSKLTLLAQIVDDDFQRSIQSLFSVNPQTQVGRIDDVCDDMVYSRGPVKLLERSRFKAQADYFMMMYPTSACLLDLNRCSLIFADIKSLLFAADWFIERVTSGNCGCVIGIVRCKNGFKEYVEETQYADIKMNVLIRGKNSSIIGEIQFLLQTMVDYKKFAHNLYAIAREEEFVSNSLSQILPSLLDGDKQHKICAAMGDIKGLCQYMVFNKKSESDVVLIEGKANQSILEPICKAGKHSAFRFIQHLMNDAALFTDHLFYESSADEGTPIECAVRNNHLLLLRDIFSRDSVKRRYAKSIKYLYRLVYWLFKDCRNAQLLQLVLNAVSLPDHDEKWMRIMNYENTANFDTECVYYKETIGVETVRFNKVIMLRKLASVMPTPLFVKKVFEVDQENVNALETAIRRGKLKHCEYLLSVEGIVDRVHADKDLMWRALYHVFAQCSDEATVEFVLASLKIDKQMMLKMMTHKCTKEDKAKSGLFGLEALKYNWNLCGRICAENTQQRLARLVQIIHPNQALFIECVMQSDGENYNAIEYAIRNNKIEIVKYLVTNFGTQIKEALQKKKKNKQAMWRILYWLCQKECKQDMQHALIAAFDLNKKVVHELQAYQWPQESSNNNDNTDAFTYYDKKISMDDVNNLLNM